MNTDDVKAFAWFHGFILTANEDGTIPLNSKMVCRVPTEECCPDLLVELLARANRPLVNQPTPEEVTT